LLRGVQWGSEQGEEYFVEHGMDRAPRFWQVKLVSRFANLLEDFERTMAFIVKFLSRSVSTYVGRFLPDLIAHLILDRSVLLPIIEPFDLVL
jgi:hypothetical protein